MNIFKKIYSQFKKTEVKRIVIGMGNPEENLFNTRHNIGYKALDDFLAIRKINLNTKNKVAHWALKDDTLYLKPQKCINSTGEMVKDFLESNYYEYRNAKVVILVDELLLPLGIVKPKKETNTSFHNGIRNMILHFGDNFDRIRIGIGEKPNNIKTIKYVLEEFTIEEQGKLKSVFESSSLELSKWVGN